MKIFIDTEFTDLVDMDLISIGLVTEAGQEFYAERDDFDVGLCNDFVRSQVLPLLRAPGASVYSKPGLRRVVDVWLSQFQHAAPVICYDNTADWAMLVDLYGNNIPAWLKLSSVRDYMDFAKRAAFFVETGLIQHHALNDAHANRCAMMLDPFHRLYR